MNLHFLHDLAVELDLDGHVGLVFAAGLEVLGHRLDAQRRVARAVPIGRMLAVVEDVLHQAPSSSMRDAVATGSTACPCRDLTDSCAEEQ